jgi:hypothetical protein
MNLKNEYLYMRSGEIVQIFFSLTRCFIRENQNSIVEENFIGYFSCTREICFCSFKKIEIKKWKIVKRYITGGSNVIAWLRSKELSVSENTSKHTHALQKCGTWNLTHTLFRCIPQTYRKEEWLVWILAQNSFINWKILLYWGGQKENLCRVYNCWIIGF